VVICDLGNNDRASAGLGGARDRKFACSRGGAYRDKSGVKLHLEMADARRGELGRQKPILGEYSRPESHLAAIAAVADRAQSSCPALQFAQYGFLDQE